MPNLFRHIKSLFFQKLKFFNNLICFLVKIEKIMPLCYSRKSKIANKFSFSNNSKN